MRREAGREKIDEDPIRESVEEHSLAELSLKRLLACSPEHPSFQAHVTATKELIEHHVKEEEEDMVPKVEKRVDEAQLKTMGGEMKARFAPRWPGHPEATTLRGTMTEQLERLLALARARPRMTAAERDEQSRNFAAGNAGLENPCITRVVVDEAIRRGSRRTK